MSVWGKRAPMSSRVSVGEIETLPNIGLVLAVWPANQSNADGSPLSGEAF